MFNDVLDESAEWRYYGADDSQIRDQQDVNAKLIPT